jgi:DNA-binding beta-propeller fold protein YncE
MPMVQPPPRPGLARTPFPAGRRNLLAGLAGALGGAAAARAQAAIDPALFDIRRYVYVPSATTPDVTVIDADTNRLVRSLRTGIVASQVVVSRSAAALVATDGRSAAVSLVDVFAGTARTLVLPAPAERLTSGTNGRLVAASDLAGGTITLIDAGEGRVDTVITGLPPLRDVMFGGQDTVLYIAAEGLDGIGVIDVASARLSQRIATFRPTRAGVAALARTPNGRQVLAQPQGGGPISVLDLEQGRPVAELAAGPGTAGMFPSGTGTYLLVPDNLKATLAVFRTERLGDPVALPGAAGVIGVYTAWLDSVAFAPSVAGSRLLIYDLDRLQPAGEIALAGTPVHGAVTPDSRTLYLPLLDPPQVVAVDGATRQVTGRFDLASRPLAALVAGGWGICH